MRLAKGSYRRAQTILEYAILFAVIVAALIAMNIYLKRGFQGRYRKLADEISTQYERGATQIDHWVNTTTRIDEYRIGANHEISVSYTDSVVNESMNQEVVGYRK